MGAVQHLPGADSILNIDAGPMCMAFTIRDDKADERAVEFARALVTEVQRFAAEVERLHTERQQAEGKAA